MTTSRETYLLAINWWQANHPPNRVDGMLARRTPRLSRGWVMLSGLTSWISWWPSSDVLSTRSAEIPWCRELNDDLATDFDALLGDLAVVVKNDLMKQDSMGAADNGSRTV